MTTMENEVQRKKKIETWSLRNMVTKPPFGLAVSMDCARAIVDLVKKGFIWQRQVYLFHVQEEESK